MSSIRIFGHYVNTRVLLLGAVEIAILFAAAWMGLHYGGGTPGESEPLAGIAMMTFVILFSMGAMGLFQPGLRAAGSGILLRIVASFAIGGAALSLFYRIFPSLYVAPVSLGVAGGAAFLGVAVTHLLFFRLTAKPWRRRVLVLGTDRNALPMTQFRRFADRRHFEVVGFVPVVGEARLPEMARQRILEGALPHLVNRLDIQEVVVAASDRRAGLPLEDLLAVRLDGIPVTDVTSFIEREAGKIRLDTVRPSWFVFGDGCRQGAVQRAVKRLIDLLGALTLVAGTWPVMLAAAALIKVEDGGPVLFRQMRVGRDGIPYRLVKFRSMRVDAEKDGARWAEKNDSRITRIGGLLRKTRIDELPQLYNVLKGEMSLVGPRPERPEFVAELTARIPYYDERHRVKPGVTGWAQLLYPYGASEKDAREKLQYDLYYVKNQSLFLDLLVLVQTVEVVLFGKGAR